MRKLNSILGEDCREHPEWGYQDYTWIDLTLNEDMSGLIWNGSDKTYQLTEKINIVLELMQKDFPNFFLKGELLCQGEDIEDRYIISVNKNGATKYSINEDASFYKYLHKKTCIKFIKKCKKVNDFNVSNEDEDKFDIICDYIDSLEDCYVKGYLKARISIFLEGNDNIYDFINMINNILEYDFKLT